MEQNQLSLEDIIQGIKPISHTWLEKARERTIQLVMPPRALGRLHELSEKLCAIQETLTPSIAQKAVLIMAADHGVASEGVSAYPQDVTGAMVQTFLNGGAGINAISRYVGADVYVVDMGIIPEIHPDTRESENRLWLNKIGKGTANMLHQPAMTSSEAIQSVLTGFHLASRLFETGVSILATGDMGIGNTTASAAIGAVITGKKPDILVGPGTGIENIALKKKIDIVSRCIELHQPDPNNGIDTLSKVGGYEIGGIAGSILAGAYHRHPVMIDGFISTAGALIAHTLCPYVIDYIFAGHCSEEPGHRSMLEHLNLVPILDLGMRLGEGTGGTLAMCIMEGAVRVFREMATFEEANVPNKT